MGGGLTPPEEGSPLYITFAYVFPCLGVLISCMFSLSPIPRLRNINREGKLRGFDPFPTVLNLGSGISWICYSVMATNPFTFTSGSVVRSWFWFPLSFASSTHPSSSSTIPPRSPTNLFIHPPSHPTHPLGSRLLNLRPPGLPRQHREEGPLRNRAAHHVPGMYLVWIGRMDGWMDG